MKELEIRYSEASDGKVLEKWLSDKRLNQWYPPTGEKEVNAFAANWISYSRYNSSLTAVLEGKICAIGTLFLMPYIKVSHQCLLYIIIDPDSLRGKEIGDSLLKNMLNLAKNYFHLELAVIELFEGAKLIELVERYGFKEFARQKKYVKEDGSYKNKILYQLFL